MVMLSMSPSRFKAFLGDYGSPKKIWKKAVLPFL